MAAKLVKTKTPCIYRRPEGTYAVVYRANGKQCWESAGNYEEARRLKSERTTDRDRGEYPGTLEDHPAGVSDRVDRALPGQGRKRLPRGEPR
jgi:hypothetical protein